MTSRDLIAKYLDFFKKRGHTVIPFAPLVPENDPTVLFTTAGMHPLAPYLLGEEHPGGKRLVDLQLCLRTDDIDEVGDTTHNTFFEMLGNWSLGDYWKKESLGFSFEFLTSELGFSGDRLWITCFEGDSDAPKDLESAETWGKLGIPKERIFFLPKKDNWWGPAGETGPCGPDSEMFYDATGKAHGANCQPGDNCGRFFEIWNNVFMQYEKTKEGTFRPLSQKNVDTGMGVERTTAVLLGLSDNYKVPDLWGDIISAAEVATGAKYEGNEKAHRIIADHIRAAVFVASEGVVPSNKERGYVLRRLIRRCVRFGKTLGAKGDFLARVSKATIKKYSEYYPELGKRQKEIEDAIGEEEEKFENTLAKGLKEVEKLKKLDGKTAFYLYESYGFPVEITEEIAKERGQKIDKKEFEGEFAKHKELSRAASAGMFRGGLIDHSEAVTKLHTATHLLHASLRKILGDHVSQKGSNITAERLRFDFSHGAKLTDEEVTKVENLINEQIKKDLPVSHEIKTLKEALVEGALAFFGEKYGEKVKVYKIGPFSMEICGGPHVSHTSEIGRVRIIRQEKQGAGIVRIYAAINNLKLKT